MKTSLKFRKIVYYITAVVSSLVITAAYWRFMIWFEKKCVPGSADAFFLLVLYWFVLVVFYLAFRKLKPKENKK